MFGSEKIERPYPAKAAIEKTMRGIKIDIPAPKEPFAILFLLVWMFFWAIGEYTAINSLFKSSELASSGFLMFWIAGWTFGGFSAMRVIIYMLFGKEHLVFEDGQLRVFRSYYIFSRKKVYSIGSITNFSLNDDFSQSESPWKVRLGGKDDDSKKTGALKFDYGMKTIEVGDNIEEPEARYLIQILQEANVLKEENL